MNLHKNSKLILLRGRPGAGKSTIARKLQKKFSGNVAILTPDYFYWQVNPGEDNIEVVNRILTFATKTYLEESYIVILEGCLPISENRSLIEKITEFCQEHSISQYNFFLQVKLKTALERNRMRKGEKDIHPDYIKEWYDNAKPNEILNEEVIHVDKIGIEEVFNKLVAKLFI